MKHAHRATIWMHITHINRYEHFYEEGVNISKRGAKSRQPSAHQNFSNISLKKEKKE